jgi:NAD(P)-dependent dehydrogenase (short-subunit alcohol dehydrogenase family)
MAGRTCMITGASSGIGRATALALARMGAPTGFGPQTSGSGYGRSFLSSEV